jgi:hypothetical protein
MVSTFRAQLCLGFRGGRFLCIDLLSHIIVRTLHESGVEEVNLPQSRHCPRTPSGRDPSLNAGPDCIGLQSANSGPLVIAGECLKAVAGNLRYVAMASRQEMLLRGYKCHCVILVRRERRIRADDGDWDRVLAALHVARRNAPPERSPSRCRERIKAKMRKPPSHATSRF